MRIECGIVFLLREDCALARMQINGAHIVMDVEARSMQDYVDFLNNRMTDCTVTNCHFSTLSAWAEQQAKETLLSASAKKPRLWDRLKEFLP